MSGKRLIELSDNDYELVEGGAWVDVGPFAIRLSYADKALSISVYNASDLITEDLGVSPIQDWLVYDPEPVQ
jgi:hypothetical protein